MSKIEELINEYKKQIENNMKYIEGEWACEADRISGMKIAVDVLRKVVKDLQLLKSSLPTQQIDGIKELIRKIDEEMFAYPEIEPEQDDEATEDFKDGYNQASEVIIGYLKELPPQQDKVVVPELIHKWIKHVKGLKWGLADLLNPSVSNSYLARDAKEWLEKDKIHAEILARAWLEDDYTVEKEPLYYVRLPFNEGNHIRTYYLRKGKVSGDTWFGSSNAEYSGNTARLAEQEIKDHDERYWAFAVPVEEDE